MSEKDTKSQPAKTKEDGINKGGNVRIDDRKLQEKILSGQMYVKVYSPYRNYFSDIADSISAVNDTGPFDILPGHHKFLTLLSSCELDIRTNGVAEKIKVDYGIMFVKENRVTVFLDV